MCCSPSDPKHALRMILRTGLGLALVFLGITHYRDPEFAVQVGAGLGALAPLGYVWGFVHPGLLIAGGVLLVIGLYRVVAASLVGIALAAIPAGLLLKSALGTLPLEASMPAALNALIWLIALHFSLSGRCCAQGAMTPAVPVAASPASRPVTPPAPKPAPAPKTAPASAPAPAVSKPAPKKKAAPKKKSVPKKTAPPAPMSGLDV